MMYNATSAKQPDSSFRPKNLPAPTPLNGLKYQPNTRKHYPTFVFEIAFTNESQNHLSTDANDKYFNADTSVQVWLGLKIDRTNNLFWAGWGRRNANGTGLWLIEQTEDNRGVATYLPVYPNPGIALPGQFTIPSTLIFHPLPLPPSVPSNLVIPIEEMRSQLEVGIGL